MAPVAREITRSDQGAYYYAHPIEYMRHHLTMVAYDMSDLPLTYVTALLSGPATSARSVSNRSSGSPG